MASVREAGWVEVHDVEELLEVEAGPPRTRGSRENPSGLRGWATPRERDVSLVETLDGRQFAVPSANARPTEAVPPEEGGYDARLPAAGGRLTLDEEQALAAFVASSLFAKGYCMLQTSMDEELRGDVARLAASREDFALPEAELEQAFLGEHRESKVAWLQGDSRHPVPPTGEAAAWERLASDDAGAVRDVASVASALAASSEELLGFAASPCCGGAFLRVPLAPGERSRLSPGSLESAVAGGDDDAVGRHLDFLQRRRLCLLHVLEGDGGHVELRPALGDAPVRLPVARGRLLIFRHDYFGYRYAPAFAEDLALQAWLLEAPPLLQLEGLEGPREALLPASFGGARPPQSSDRQVHIMSAHCKFPGEGNGLPSAWIVYSEMVDGFIEMPKARWDVDVYYDADATQFGMGKSSTKHAALLAYEELMSFDNKFFGIPDTQAYMLPPTTRLLMETSYSCLFFAGYNLETLKGANIALNIADIGQEWDPFMGLRPPTEDWNAPAYDPDTWARSTHMHSVSSACQVAMKLGTTGPVQCIDTACSSSLVTASMIHASLRKYDSKVDFTEGLSMGHQGVLSPFAFIGLSGAGMLGRCGRCMTFDRSANGYNRGEGVGGLFMSVTEDAEAAAQRLGNYVSSFINQDGRSASLTAPNGPSQQAVIRNSMRLEDIEVQDIVTTENHGTGTALGDPIEVGSVRSVFRKHPTCVPVTSGKTHMGHLESTAGSVGLLKTLLSLVFSASAPNVHLYELNAHIDTAGFPGLFPTELLDLRSDAALAGLNGFGFGGTNCRSELWAKSLRGHRAVPARKARERRRGGQPWELGGREEALEAADCVTETCPRCWGPMCWRCGQAYPAEVDQGRHRCRAIRQEFSAYEHCSDCFGGSYQFGRAVPSGMRLPRDRGVFLAGSWDNWSEMEEMRQISEGLFVGNVRMGDVGFESFHFVVDGDREQCILPVGQRVSADARIVGPLPLWRRGSWLIDGRADRAPEGTMYEVRLEWTETSRAVAWRRLGRRTKAMAQRHSYHIAASTERWRPVEMRRSADAAAWEFEGDLGPGGEAAMYFLRDGDAAQAIAPLDARPPDGAGPVVGPCPSDPEKAWICRGPPHGRFLARLALRGGGLRVDLGAASWRSRADSAGDAYHAVGSFCDWRLALAVPLVRSEDPSRPGLFRGRFFIGEAYREEFQIVVNKCWTQVLYPSAASPAGQGFLQGPGPADRGLHWRAQGDPGLLVEVALDFGAADSLEMVTCRAADEAGAGIEDLAAAE